MLSQNWSQWRDSRDAEFKSSQGIASRQLIRAPTLDAIAGMGMLSSVGRSLALSYASSAIHGSSTRREFRSAVTKTSAGTRAVSDRRFWPDHRIRPQTRITLQEMLRQTDASGTELLEATEPVSAPSCRPISPPSRPLPHRGGLLGTTGQRLRAWIKGWPGDHAGLAAACLKTSHDASQCQLKCAHWFRQRRKWPDHGAISPRGLQWSVA